MLQTALQGPAGSAVPGVEVKVHNTEASLILMLQCYLLNLVRPCLACTDCAHVNMQKEAKWEIRHTS